MEVGQQAPRQGAAALDDAWVRLGLELGSMLDPANPVVKEDLAYLERR